MPSLLGLRGRLLIALTLILFCVAVGLAVVLGSGDNQRPAASGFGDLAATVEAKRTATAPTSTSTPTPQPAPPTVHLDVAMDNTQPIPLLTMGNQGESELTWRLWGVYRSPLGSAQPLRVAVLGADAFDTFLLLEADADLAQDFHFVNGGDDWTAEAIQSYDLLVVSEPLGGLSKEEMAALTAFQASGRGLLLGLGEFDSLSNSVYASVADGFGVNGSTLQDFVPGTLNPGYSWGQGSLMPVAGVGSLHLTSADWVVQGRNGAIFLAAREDMARRLIFGGALSVWLASNPDLMRQTLDWVGNAWLFLQPLAGQVPAQSSQVITGLLDTSGFFAGSHTLDVVVESNDPAAPRLHVPMRLQVSGESRLGTGSHSLDFGRVYVGYEQVRSLRIDNPGVAELQVALSVDDSAFHVQPQRLVVRPRASGSVTVTFRPTLSQTLASAIRINSNDPISPTWQVAVTGQALVPPAIALLSVDQGQVLTRTFSTTNAQIEVGIPQVEWPTPSPTATISTSLSILPTPTPNPGASTPRPTATGTPSVTVQAGPVATATITSRTTGTPTVQTSIVATHSNTPSSTATPGSTPDSTPATADATPTPAPLVLARGRGTSEIPILALPEEDAAVVTLLGPETIFLASARTQATDWLFGHTTGMTLTGWIAVQELVVIGDPQRLPIQTP